MNAARTRRIMRFLLTQRLAFIPRYHVSATSRERRRYGRVSAIQVKGGALSSVNTMVELRAFKPQVERFPRRPFHLACSHPKKFERLLS